MATNDRSSGTDRPVDRTRRTSGPVDQTRQTSDPVVPAPLLDLPAPWNRLDQDPRDSLVASTRTRLAAVDVIDRCLHALDALPEVSDEFPEYVTIAWSLWSAMFVRAMPTFDAFRQEPIAKQFRQQDPEVSDALVRRYAIAWVRKQVSSLVDMAQGWLFLSMRDEAEPDPEAIGALHRTLERWWRSDQLFATLALDDLWMLDRAGSTELLRLVATSPDASPELSARMSELLARP